MVLITFLGTVILTFYFYKVCKFKKLLAVLAGLPGTFAPIVTTLFKTLKNTLFCFNSLYVYFWSFLYPKIDKF